MFSSYIKFLMLILAVISLSTAQDIIETQDIQDDDLNEFPEHSPIQQRALNYVNVQLPQSKPEMEAISQSKPMYITYPSKEYYTTSTPYETNYYPQYFLNSASLTPTPLYSYYPQNSYQTAFYTQSKPEWFQTTNKPHYGEYSKYGYPATQTPVVAINPDNQQQQQNQQQLTNNLTKQNYTELLMAYLPRLFSQLNFYNTPLPQDKLKETFAILSPNFQEISAASKPVNNFDYTKPKPTGIEAILSPLIIPNGIIENPTKPTTAPLQELLLQKLGNRRRIQEQVGAIYLRNLLYNRR